MGDIKITCRAPARPFPTEPGGKGLYSLRGATSVYEISEDGTRKLVPSEVHPSGNGRDRDGTDSETEWSYFYLHLPLEPAELDAEAKRYFAKLEESMAPEHLTEEARHTALENIRDSVYQHRVGRFHVECDVVDGDRVIGVGSVELEVLFKGRFSDIGLSGAPPA